MAMDVPIGAVDDLDSYLCNERVREPPSAQSASS
jgi:hypothetical protein